ncbi:MAG: tol-pal system protein YbgF [Alphaproteobacteria bacterium]
MMPRRWIGVALTAALVAATPAAAQTPQVYAQQELRLTQLEDQIRQLTGRVEELTFQLQQVRGQLERAQRDTDFRMTELERSRGQGGAPPAAEPPAPPPPQTRPAPPPPAAAAPPPPPASPAPPPRQNLATAPQPAPGQSRVVAPPGPGTTTMRPGSAPGTPPPPPAASTPPPPPPQHASTPRAPQPEGTLPAGPPQQQYDHAFSLLARADYEGAERALKAFLRQHPSDGLAGNAQYWLGETYYVRQDYQNAAIAFGEGFQRYPRSTKAPDNLLKLGMSLAQLNKRQEACGALGRLDQMNDAPANVKDRAKRERQRIGC